MRFVLSCLLCLHPLLPFCANATPPQRGVQRASVLDVPMVPSDFSVRKIRQNLGDVSALANIGHDIFVLDRKRERILKLRDQNGDGIPDIQTVFLVGFDAPSHMVADAHTLYISDAQGVWHLRVGTSLNTDTIPTLLFPRTHTPPLSKTPLAIHPKTHSLYIAEAQRITRVDTKTLQTSLFASSLNPSLSVAELTVTPTGGLWAAVSDDISSAILPLSPNANFDIRPSRSTKATSVQALTFVQAITFWKNSLLIAQAGTYPKIVKRTFQYGELNPSPKTFVEGFFRPSALLGEMRIWGEPSAIALMTNGDFIFAERRTQSIWRVSKAPIRVKHNSQTSTTTPNPPTANEETTSKEKITKTPRLLHGSSIQAASSIQHGSMLKTSKELDTDKFSYREATQDDDKTPPKKD